MERIRTERVLTTSDAKLERVRTVITESSIMELGITESGITDQL